MSEPKHTAGPWRRRKEWKSSQNRLEIFPVNRKVRKPFSPCSIALVSDHYEEAVANAILIASAPDLLECLQEIRDMANMGYSKQVALEIIYTKVRAAIAKAQPEGGK